jgi:hypothetical protein
MMDRFVMKGVIEVCFKLIKGNGLALNANRFSLPVIRYFTVALQYRCPLALNTNVGSSFWAPPPFFKEIGPNPYDLSIFRHPALRLKEFAFPHRVPGSICPTYRTRESLPSKRYSLVNYDSNPAQSWRDCGTESRKMFRGFSEAGNCLQNNSWDAKK